MGEPRGLRKLVLSASMWTSALSVATQVIRFGSNLVLTRLLAPEAFGLMALVTSIRVGTEMLTDVGIGPAVISSDRIYEPAFQHTAWTVRALRGVLVGIGVALLGYPAALWFEEPQLAPLMIGSGAAMALSRWNHICDLILDREMKQRPLFWMELCAVVLTTLLTILLAWWMEDVWALVIGPVIGDVVRFVYTHWIGRQTPARFGWNKSVVSELRRYGFWVFFSSALTYLHGQGDRLILGSFMSMRDLGQYAIAVTLVSAPTLLTAQLSSKVMLPLYASVGKTTDDRLRGRVRKLRLGLAAVSIPPMCFLFAFGDKVVETLWDPRYHDAGWMTRVLALGIAVQSVGEIGPVHLARGETWVAFASQVVRVVGLVGGMIAGNMIAGIPGLIGGVAAAHAVGYPVGTWIARRYGLWLPRVDLLSAAFAAGLIACGLLLRNAIWPG